MGCGKTTISKLLGKNLIN
ncbi:MAG: hypothetical protein ACLTAI_00375 [Thomasclavelia sp.]